MSKKKKGKVKTDDKAYVYAVKNKAFNDVFFAAWDSILYPGTPVMYETKFGQDMGVVLGPSPLMFGGYFPGSEKVHGACSACSDSEEGEGYPCFQIPKEPEKIEIRGDFDWIDHLATPSEMARYQENTLKEREALRVCKEKAEKRGIDMKVVSAHFLLGEPKVVFFYTADNRVDFRDLVKDLGQVFRMRIEMRQINTREEAKIVGGLSVCGREACCHSVSGDFESGTLKMAKAQNLSLDLQKITGLCGKYFCCLRFEYENYLEDRVSASSDRESQGRE